MKILILAALVLLAYAPTLTQPLLEDDYPNIVLAQSYGPISGWHVMLGDPVFRLRTTTWLLFYNINRLFGMHAAAYYAVMIMLQVLNTWLVYGLGIWRPLGFRLSLAAAAFFAVYEGHQEAIMWVSGCTEPLLVCFGLIAFLCWVRFLDGHRWPWYAASLMAFCAALFSKESAVILVPILALPLLFEPTRRRASAFLIPMAILAACCAASVLYSRTYNFRFQDGSFSFHAPFWLIWPNNFVRLFWVWGLVSLIAILIWRPAHYRAILAIGMSWAGTALIPYCFLTYSLRIPSRQVHLASVGLALVVGFALLTVYDRYWSRRRVLIIAVYGLVLASNVLYLWTKKRAQFLERAAPTEQLIALARSTGSPIYVQCFPRNRLVAESLIQLRSPGKQLIWDAAEAQQHSAVTFCYVPGAHGPS